MRPTYFAFITLAASWLTAHAGVLQDAEPAAYSARIDGPLQERMLDMTTDSAGNVYITGSFSSAEMALQVFGDAAGDTGAVEEKTSQKRSLRAMGGEDVFVAKYDAKGNLLWARSAGGMGQDYGTGVVVDNSGNVYITGSYSGTADIGGTSLNSSLRTVASGQGAITDGGLQIQSDLFVAMLDSNGVWRWAKRLDYSLRNVSTTSNYVSYKRIDFGGNSEPVLGGYQRDGGNAFNGTYGWTKWGNVNEPQNNFQEGSWSGTRNGQTTDANTRTYIHAFDPNGEDNGQGWRMNLPAGTYQFTMKCGSLADDDDDVQDVFLTTSDNPTGHIQVFNAVNPGPGQQVIVMSATITFTLSQAGWMWLRPDDQENYTYFNSLDLNVLQTPASDISVGGTFGIRSGDDAHAGKALAIDQDGHLYVKGRFIDTQNMIKTSGGGSMGVRFITATGTEFLLDDDSSSTGARNSFVTRLKLANSSASKIDPAQWQWDWLTQFGTSYTDDASAKSDNTIIADLAVDPVGDVMVAGSWRGRLTAGGAPVDVTNNSPAAANTEGFVLRLRRSDGSRNMLAPIRVTGGTPANRVVSPESLVLDGEGNAYVAMNLNSRIGTGGVGQNVQFQSATGGPALNVSSASDKDFAVAKLDTAGEWKWTAKPTSSGQRTVHALARDPGGNLYVTGALISGATTFGVTSLAPTSTNSVTPFIAKLTPAASGSSAAWTAAVGEQSNAPLEVTNSGWQLVAASSSEITNLAQADAALQSISNPIPWTRLPNINHDTSSSSDQGIFGGDSILPVYANNFAYKATATLVVTTPGAYLFGINTDDGGRLRIDGMDVIVNDVLQSPTTATGSATLPAGSHSIEYVFFNRSGGGSAEAFYYQDGVPTLISGNVPFGRDCGASGQFTGGDGVGYLGDGYFTGGGTSSHTTAISGTTDDTLYQSERYGTNFSYSLPVANGEYRVTLKWAEGGYSTANQRKFDVTIQGQKVLDDFDIVAAAGGRYVAVDRSFDVTVNGGAISVLFTGNQGTPDVNAKIDAIRIEKMSTQNRHHGVQVAVAPNGTLWWLVSSGRDSALDRDLLGTGVGGGGENGATYYLGTRSAPNRSSDRTAFYGGFLLAANLDLGKPPLNDTGYFVGQEIVPPAGVFLDSLGRPMQPEIYINGLISLDAANYFHWDASTGRLYVLQPVANAEIRWRVSADLLNSARLIQPAEVRLPKDSDRFAGDTSSLVYQTHVSGGGVSEDEPAVEIETAASSYQFTRLLTIGASTATISGKTFKTRAEQTRDVWTTLVYTRKASASTSLPNTLVLPVRTVHFRDVQSAPMDAKIGEEIRGALFGHNDPSGKNGFVMNIRSRYDGTGPDAAHIRAERAGPIIPVNMDEPGDDDNLVIAWYSVNARTSVPWPTSAWLYHAIWPPESTTFIGSVKRNTPEKIFIVSQRGSEMELFGANTSAATVTVNCGGGSFTAGDGTFFAADGGFTPSTSYSHTHAIEGTNDDPLFQSGRSGPSFSYALPTGNGTFQVRLYFAERAANPLTDPDVPAPPPQPTVGTDISVEDTPAVSGVVISERVGAADTADFLDVSATVSDGVLNLKFEKAEGFDEAQINAIKVTPAFLFTQDKLNPTKYLNRRIYHQPDKSKPGYNPNEEHALLAPSMTSAFEAVFALRNDLNHRGTITSEPYALMKYQDADDGGKWKFKVYKVEVTGSISVGDRTQTFDFTNFTGLAGRRVQAPYPLSLFPDQMQTSYEAPPAGVRNAYWKDRKGAIWARSEGQVVAKYWYPVLASFWLDADGGGTQDAASATPWLEYYAGTNSTPQVGDAVKVIYDIAWPPLVPKLFVGETLREAKRGMPDVFHWASGAIIFDENELAVNQLEPGGAGSSSMLRLTARLMDSMSERSVPLAAKIAGTFITDEAGVELNMEVALAEAGRYEFPKLEPHLRSRVRFDPNTKRLIFRGIYDTSQPAAPIELLNILSVGEREELKALDDRTASIWDTAVQALFQITRNPNGVNPALINGELSSDIYAGIQHRVDANGVVKNDIVPENVRAGMVLSAGLAEGVGYITLTENNDPALGAAPVALHVIKVVEPAVVGSVRVILSQNPLDEKITLRHSADFAGAPDDLFFEWFAKQDTNGRPGPTDIPQNSGGGNGWLPLQPGALGLNSVTIEGSGIRTLADQWIYVRYRKGTPSELAAAGLPYRTNFFPADFAPDGADLAGDPAYVSKHSPMFCPGWIKRVLEGINPFEQRVKDFHDAPTSSYITMIQQAGGPFQGPVALNSSAENLNQVGLIELYETILRRGFELSINGTPSQTNAAVNNSLLLAASRISDLYMLLGNEAFADAQDPTIGFNVDGGNETNTIDSSSFAFQNQLPSLIHEELGLLRGRDDSAAGVEAAPVFNRLYWNFTSGLEGEPAYVLNYEITDTVGGPAGARDGFIREDDAAYTFPMGHGDAWGHYLNAVKGYYRLLRHPSYTWTPRSEFTIVAGVGINVDYLDEQKFARAASARARAAESIVELTYRDKYVADPAGQWQGYKDTDPTRSWGVDEWARRAGQGAYLDWAVANAILKEQDDNGTSSLDKIDRQTVGDLGEIASSFTLIQGELDKADKGLNPLGLHNDVVPFDIDPNFTETEADILGQTHFEQVYGRAIAAVDNARRTFDHASSLTEQLRTLKITSDEFRAEIAGGETDFRNRLIEIFGYPYSGDIGPGKAFPTGYDGPDIYKWMYVPVADLTGDTLPPVAEETEVFYKAFTFNSDLHSGGTFEDVLGHYFPDDVPEGGLLADNSALPNSVPFTLSAGRWAFAARPEMGDRRAPGRLQLALNAILQAQAALETAQTNYDGLVLDIRDARDLLQARFDLQDHDIAIKTSRNAAVTSLNGTILALNAVKDGADLFTEAMGDHSDGFTEALPKVVGLASDPSGPARLGVKSGAALSRTISRVISLASATTINSLEFTKDQTEMWTELEIEKGQYSFEIQEELKALEALLRNEINARLEIFTAMRALEAAVGDFQITLAEGQRVMEERLMFRRKMAGPIQALRYEDITFRNFRNESLQRYKASFDLAARYAFLAAKTYDYETCMLGSDTKAGQHFLTDIIKQRSLGQFVEDLPVHGVNGLSDPLARMRRSFAVLKSQLGFNNPQVETGQFSLRHELFRLRDASDEEWQKTLANHRVPDLWKIPEFRKFCRPFAPEEAGAQPGVVISFGTNITYGLNFFGWPLAGGDSAYDSSRFTTKARSVGVWLENYSALNLSTTPRIYLIPVGSDVMRSPTGDSQATREFQVIDQALPDPFPIGASDLNRDNFIPFNDSLDNSFLDIRRFSRFRAYHDAGTSRNPNVVEMVRDTRLVGRSVWNTRWLLIIPGGTFLNDPSEGLETFIFGKKVPGSPTQRDGNGNQDIKLFFETYSYSGL